VNPNNAEIKAAPVFMADAASSDRSAIITRFSSWPKALRVVAWMFRFVTACKLKTPASGPLKPKEIETAESCLLRCTQEEAFSGELERLRQEKPVRLSSSLSPLNPRLEDEVLVMGGRSPSDAAAPWNPVILPAKSHVTKLVIRQYHAMQGHGGTEQTHAALRRRYWIIHGKSSVKRELRDCRWCRRRKGQPQPQVMGPLLSAQTQPSRPFEHVGVDYFGPFLVKIGRTNQKRYVCLFTCLAMRAVHLEVTHALSTDSFLAAFARFAARRGYLRRIYSDNGTNFVGAEKELRHMLHKWDQDIIGDRMSQHGIEWIFNPPLSSHKGGLWERMIRSARSILATTMKGQTTTEEALSILMTEVERILNDRPLTPVSNDPNDPKALTSNDLLLLRGVPNLVPPTSAREEWSRRWWRQAQRLADIFWSRWLHEYVPMLHRRQKWRREARDFKEGDGVLVAGSDAPRGRWPLGVVTQAYKSDDGRVRTCEVRCECRLYKRLVTKLCLVDGAEEQL
jgi:hypothetical protein